MAYIIIKSAGDEFSFTTMFVPGDVGHTYAYAGALAAKVTKAMKAVEQSRALDLPETWAQNEHPSACAHRKACIFYKPASQ